MLTVFQHSDKQAQIFLTREISFSYTWTIFRFSYCYLHLNLCKLISSVKFIDPLSKDLIYQWLDQVSLDLLLLDQMSLQHILWTTVFPINNITGYHAIHIKQLYKEQLYANLFNTKPLVEPFTMLKIFTLILLVCSIAGNMCSVLTRDFK